jgi:hypothetical protein
MPLRKGNPITIAVAAVAFGLAFAPAGAQAAGLADLFKPKAATTASTTPTATTPPAAPAASTTTATKDAVTTTAAANADTPLPAAAPASCTALPTTKAFSKVDGDASDYSVAPGGGFEPGTAGWTLAGGARVVTGNETLGVTAGKKSLQMPLNSTATSPQFCIDQTNPHFRFAYKVDNAALSGFISYVVYRDATGRITNIELLSSKVLALAPSKWQPSPLSPLATLLPLNGVTKSATVQLKILALNPTDLIKDTTAVFIGPNILINGVAAIAGGATGLVAGITSAVGVNIGVSIDSVMVDPYRRG